MFSTGNFRPYRNSTALAANKRPKSVVYRLLKVLFAAEVSLCGEN
jgi:hypothetical protein